MTIEVWSLVRDGICEVRGERVCSNYTCVKVDAEELIFQFTEVARLVIAIIRDDAFARSAAEVVGGTRRIAGSMRRGEGREVVVVVIIVGLVWSEGGVV